MNNGKSLRVLLTGGGSGGHVSPLLAIADALKAIEPDTRFLFVGVRHGLEAYAVPHTGLRIRFAPARGLPARKLSLKMLGFLLSLLFGTLKATLILIGFRPKVMVASGGYASAPSVFASALLTTLTLGLWRIPIYLHEQNAIPGRMNLFAGRLATRIGVSHETARTRFTRGNVELVGYPVRASLKQMSREEARKMLGIGDNEIYLVAFGGSQGARTLNRALIDALPLLAKRKNLRVMHACGTMKNAAYHARADTEERLAALRQQPEGYTLVDYLHDLPVHLTAADLAVIRAGAGSLVEACAAGVPAVVIPKANLPGDSQVANARDLETRGAIRLIYEEPCLSDEGLIESVSGKRLAEEVEELIENPGLRSDLAKTAEANYDPEASTRIARRVIALARQKTLSADDMAPANIPAPSANAKTRRTLPSGAFKLRRWVESKLGFKWEDAFIHGEIRDHELGRLPDLEYLRYRGAALLVHDAWPLRNEGVKLTGLTRHEQRYDLLAHLVTDRTPAPAMHRLIGGDLQNVGFVRRNVLSAFAFIGTWNGLVRNAVLASCSDPYYEVRATAMRLLRHLLLKGIDCGEDFIEPVRCCCSDTKLEVRWEALHTYGFIGQPADVLTVCKDYLQDAHPPVREAILSSYNALLERDGFKEQPELFKELERDLDFFAITSIAFHPHFPLKERYVHLRSRLSQREEP